MDKIVILVIWVFLYSIFWAIANYSLYFLWFIFKLPFDLIYTFWSVLGFTNFWLILLNTIYYLLIFWGFKWLFNQFTK